MSGWIKRLFGRRPEPICYRCGGKAQTEHAGYAYCRICRDVIVLMSPAVGHDPPIGFPGAPPGYTKRDLRERGHDE